MLSNDACASTHCRFDQFATADARLPFQPAICLRGFYVDISLAGLLGVRPPTAFAGGGMTTLASMV